MKKFISVLILLLAGISVITCFGQNDEYWSWGVKKFTPEEQEEYDRYWNEVTGNNSEYEVLPDGSIYIGGRATTEEERAEIEAYNNNGRNQEQQRVNEGNSLSQKITTPRYQQMNIDQFYQLYSLNMNNRGYSMSADDCQLKYQNIVGNYFECKVTNDVKLTIGFDDELMVTVVDVIGWQKNSGALKKETDAAFRSAYSCFFTDTRETTYQQWIKNIKIGMERDSVYTVNDISAIWGEGLLTSDSRYYYKITFFLTDNY